MPSSRCTYTSDNSNMESDRLKALRTTGLKALIERLQLYPLTSEWLAEGRLLPFVRGLIFSTYLMDEIRPFVTKYCLDWGHVIDDDGCLSPEADIIVYDKGGQAYIWRNETIRFAFVHKRAVRLVIECKASVSQITKDDKTKWERLSEFVPEVWFFAECCVARDPARALKLGSQLADIGFGRFWYLYRWYEYQDMNVNEEGWHEFIETITKL